MTRAKMQKDKNFSCDVIVSQNGDVDNSDKKQHKFPLINTVFGAPAKCRFREERKKVLKLSVRKLRQIEDAETFLCRSVLINNTMKRIQHELMEEKAFVAKKSFCEEEQQQLPFHMETPEEVEQAMNDSSSSSSNSSTDSSSSSSSNSSSDDEDEASEDELLSASEMKKAKKRRLGISKEEAKAKCSKSSTYESEEDLLNEVPMGSAQSMIMCMEDENQMTVPLPLCQQEEANRGVDVASSSDKLSITPFWSSSSSSSVSNDLTIRSYAGAYDGNTWPQGSCGQAPWVTISPTTAPGTSACQSGSNSYSYSVSKASFDTHPSPSNSHDKDLWSQLLPTTSAPSSSAFSWTISRSPSDMEFNSGNDFDQQPSQKTQSDCQQDDPSLSRRYSWDKPKNGIDVLPESNDRNIFDSYPFQFVSRSTDPNAQVDSSPAGSPESQSSDGSAISDVSSTSSCGAPVDASSSYLPKGKSAANAVSFDQLFSCGQSSMFGELQSVVFNGLITSLES